MTDKPGRPPVCNTATVSKRSNIDEQLESLNAMIASLREQINYLQDKLTPISINLPNPNECCEKKLSPQMSSVAERIKAAADEIQKENQRLEYITRCLEV